MATKLYYTVEKQTQDVGDDIQELTGWKSIVVYEIANDRPKVFFEIDEAENANSTEKEIQEWLDNNGYGEREYDFIWL